jgi:hypothetical protein
MAKVFEYTVTKHNGGWNRRHGFMQVAGYEANVISGLASGHAIYTGRHASETGCVADLVGQMKAAGLTGVLRKV